MVSEAQGKGGGAKFEVESPSFFFFVFVSVLKRIGVVEQAVFQADWAVLPGEKKAKKHKFKVASNILVCCCCLLLIRFSRIMLSSMSGCCPCDK